ncbi:MAG: protein kinase [Deltaproteobacteria bacterium]|nr:protein kinase [Deltaproteobacteria bacterium]
MKGAAAVVEGRVLADKYQLIEELGAGGMGTVWRARHLTLEADVAVKILHPELAEREQTLERFLREAKAGAQLRSPHVVQILDHGLDEGTAFICMELLEGESLADRLEQRGRLRPEVVQRVMIHVERAVSRAHQAGIVHRDLKPDNVFLVDNDGEIVAKVLDFGVAKRSATELADDATASVETATGALLGTPYYMGPEQLVSGAEVDHRADLWAMAVMTYECLCGTRPFGGATIGDVVLSVCSAPPPVPSDQGPVPAGFDQWFATATRREPTDRYDSARQQTEALVTVLARSADGMAQTTDRSAALGPESPAALLATAPTVATAPKRRARVSANGGDGPEPHPGGESGAPAPSGPVRYLVQKEGKVHTYEEAKLLKQLRKNDLSGLELIRRESDPEWQPLYETELFRREVPHRGDPRDAARWRQLRDFGAHLAIWVVVCWVVTFPWSGGWHWWKWFWGLFVAIHGARVAPTAWAMWREGKLLPWKRRHRLAPGAAETTRGLPDRRPDEADRSTGAAGLEQEVDHLRELLSSRTGAAAAGLRQRLDQLASAARQLATRQAAIESEITPEREQELSGAEQQAHRRAAEAKTDLERDLCTQELTAIGERRQAMAAARQALQPLRARRNVAAHQLEQLRIDLASADARALRLPDLSSRIDEIRIEAEAIEEVEEALAERIEQRR